MVAEIKMLRAQNAGLIGERDALKGQVSILERIAVVERERGDFYRVASEKAMATIPNSSAIDALRVGQFNLCEQENARLRIDNEKLRSSRNTRAIITGLIGVGAGYAIGNR